MKRDLSSVPVGQVGFDDMCGLQSYFDTLASKKVALPALISSTEIEGRTGTRRDSGGRSRYAFQTDFQLETFRRVLRENWKRLPDEVWSAKRVDLEVYWSNKAGLRRVATDMEAELIVGRESWKLPYHVCLSELLFGAPLYEHRRVALDLPPLAAPPGSVLPSEAARDAGAADAHLGTSSGPDGGAGSQDGREGAARRR